MFNRLFDLNCYSDLAATESALEYMNFRAIMGEEDSDESDDQDDD